LKAILLTNKDLFLKNTLRKKEWISPGTGAVFVVVEPNARQLIEITKISKEKLGEEERQEKTLKYVWANLVIDQETGRRFLPTEVDELFDVKGFEELTGPLAVVSELCGVGNEEALRKNLKPTI
jgi:hypothetical protein